MIGIANTHSQKRGRAGGVGRARQRADITGVDDVDGRQQQRWACVFARRR